MNTHARAQLPKREKERETVAVYKTKKERECDMLQQKIHVQSRETGKEKRCTQRMKTDTSSVLDTYVLI